MPLNVSKTMSFVFPMNTHLTNALNTSNLKLYPTKHDTTELEFLNNVMIWASALYKEAFDAAERLEES